MGEPSFDTPPAVITAVKVALDDGATHYAHPFGDPELRDLLARRLSTAGANQFARDDVLVTHGGTGGLGAAILGIVDPGDKVVIPDPTYSLYADLVHLAGGTTVRVPLQTDLHWDLDRLVDEISDAKAFVFCNPSNPTGIVHTGEELARVAETVAHCGTIVIADEAYSELIYGDASFTSALSVEGLAERTVYCQTFSKAYAMTGWRIGYLAGPRDVIAAAARIHSTMAGPLNQFVQRAALAAATSADDAIETMRASYGRRREVMVTELVEIDQLELSVPDGAFYAFPRYDHPMSALEMVAHLRTRGVAVRPGSEFGPAGEGHLRLSFAADEDAIRTGVRRMAAAFHELANVA
jgi:aspartate aminotransferase